MENYYDFCQDSYLKEYQSNYEKLGASFPGGKIPSSKLNEIEAESQKAAMKNTFMAATNIYANVSPAEIWKAIHIAHMYRKTNIKDLNLISTIVSADQSWKKSSGHAFEETVKEFSNIALAGTNIKVILQKDLTSLLKAKTLANENRDYDWLKAKVKSSVFDLFVLVSENDKQYCFGCIQAKTSVRDRVTRDREPSIDAMASFFWSVIFVLDDEFLKLPKFIDMVNGGTQEFQENGWHGMYALSENKYDERIYGIGIDFERFKKHAQKAAKLWLTQRQWFDNTWIAE